MDYKRFRFKAVVDWIEIEIHAEKHTNFQTVQEKLRNILSLPENKDPYIEALDKGAGSRATVFRFRIYDPKNWNQVTQIVWKLAKYFVFAGTPKVTAIEVAFDAYSKGEATGHELAALVESFYRNMTYVVSNNRRSYRDYKGSVESMYTRRPSQVRRIEEGRQIGVGNKNDDQYQHAYLKATDNGGILPVTQHRARLEIRLQGAEIPSQSFDEWEHFRFESLSRFFRFRKLKAELDPFTQMLVDALPQIGERIEHKGSDWDRKWGRKRLHNKATLADGPLNDKARFALRNLSDRWARVRKLQT